MKNVASNTQRDDPSTVAEPLGKQEQVQVIWGLSDRDSDFAQLTFQYTVVRLVYNEGFAYVRCASVNDKKSSTSHAVAGSLYLNYCG